MVDVLTEMANSDNADYVEGNTELTEAVLNSDAESVKILLGEEMISTLGDMTESRLSMSLVSWALQTM